MLESGHSNRRPSQAARALSLENRHAKLLARNADNRLEPECFPALKPKFKFAPGASIFTVGSCFARNIETRLAQLGFQVPTLQVDDAVLGEVGVNLLNKYTPASIWQELSWAHGIRKRGGVVTESDVGALFFDLGGGKVADLHLYPLTAVDRDFAMRRRKAVFKVFNAAFDSDVVTITLGLIEAWFDSETGLYVIRCPEKFFTRAPDRFRFERLSFAQCKSFVDRTIELLRNEGRSKKILLTTSPVVLGRTFTADDVIVANTYSKSVLRAVAGQVCDENDGVDYFPAFESVMLTKQNHVWEDNLTHVSKEFVAKIIDRVVTYYVDQRIDGGAGNLKLHDDARKIAALVLAGNLTEAASLYRSIAERALDIDGYSWHAAAAAAAAKLGETQKARHHAAKALATEPTAPATQQLLTDVLLELGMQEEAGRVRKQMLSLAPRSPQTLQGVVAMLAAAGRLGEAIEIERLVVSHHPQFEEGCLKLVKLLNDNGQRQYAIEASKIAAHNNPRSPRCRFNLAMLLQEAGNLAEAKSHLLAAVDLDAGNENFRLKLARLHEAMGEMDMAAEIFRPMVELPEVSHAASRQYAGFLVRREKYQRATVEIERLMARFPEDDTLARLGERAKRGLRSAAAAG